MRSDNVRRWCVSDHIQLRAGRRPNVRGADTGKSVSKAFAISTVLVVVAFASACPPSGPGKCTEDAQCTRIDPYHACELKTGTCKCTDDRGCGIGDFCNALGDCQTVSGCTTNDDCNPG